MPTDQGSLLSIGASSWVLALTHYQTGLHCLHLAPSSQLVHLHLLESGKHLVDAAAHRWHSTPSSICRGASPEHSHCSSSLGPSNWTTRPTPTPTATTTVRVTLRRGQLQSRRALVMSPDGDDSFGRLPIRAEWLHCLEILDALGTYWKPPASLDVATIKH